MLFLFFLCEETKSHNKYFTKDLIVRAEVGILSMRDGVLSHSKFETRNIK